MEKDAHLIQPVSLIFAENVTLIRYVKNLLFWYIICFLLLYSALF